jgi:hypothetical protein
MTPDDVYQFFGSANKASKAIGVTRGVVSKWTTAGYIPFEQQKKFQSFTKKKLIARVEDTKKYNKNHKADSDAAPEYYLPSFKYFDKKNGMCEVESIYFRRGKPPKIIYAVTDNKCEKFTTFTTETLIQAINVLDKDGKMVYEGDICLLSTREKFIVTDRNLANTLKRAGKFKIIGNILEK